MHSAKDILKALGFNAQAPESTKTAFLNQLSRAANELQKAEVIEPNFTSRSEEHLPEQLSFDSKLLGFKATS